MKIQAAFLFGESKGFLDLLAVAPDRGMIFECQCPGFTFCSACYDLKSLLASSIANVVSGEDVQTYGASRPMYSFTCGRDVVVWLLDMLVGGPSELSAVASQFAVNPQELVCI